MALELVLVPLPMPIGQNVNATRRIEMGMQCTFGVAEAMDQNCEVDKIYHADSNTYSAVIHDKGMVDAFITANYSESPDGDFCWFDVGMGTEEQLAKIKWLIYRRICFDCS